MRIYKLRLLGREIGKELRRKRREEWGRWKERGGGG